MGNPIGRSSLLRIGLVLLVLVGILGAGSFFFFGGLKASPGPRADDEQKESADAEGVDITVMAINPRYDRSFTMKVNRPADVLPYFVSDLETKVTGEVSLINTDAGDVVKQGETLITVSVPDLEAKVAQQTANVQLAEAQVKQKVAAIETAEAEDHAAKARIVSREAKWRADKAYLSFREKQAERYRQLLAERSIDARLVDEQEDRREAALEAVNSAVEAVNTARADKEATVARIKQAKADLEEAESKVRVAKAELNYSKAMVEYATVEAPFDGIVVRRNVDPGFFVQNAGNGHATPMLTIQRSDIVTIVMHVPDIYAPFVTPQTEAIFETPTLPGVKIHGKVTRYPDSLVNPRKDRTLPVEVDLWNEDPAEYAKKMNDKKFTDRLKKGLPGDPLNGRPIVPQIKGKLAAGRRMHLMPGMFGDMTLVLQKFDHAYLLPSKAIVTIGGYEYIYVVQDGKAHLQPVKVTADDGKLALLELLNSNGEVVGPLTGKEEVIVTNQGELSEGQLVKPTLLENWNNLDRKMEKKE